MQISVFLIINEETTVDNQQKWEEKNQTAPGTKLGEKLRPTDTFLLIYIPTFTWTTPQW